MKNCKYILIDSDGDRVTMKPLDERRQYYSSLKEAESDAEYLAQHNGTKVSIFRLVKTVARGSKR